MRPAHRGDQRQRGHREGQHLGMRPEQEAQGGRGREQGRGPAAGPGGGGRHEQHARDGRPEEDGVGERAGPKLVRPHPTQGAARGQRGEGVEPEVIAVEAAVAPLEVVAEGVVDAKGHRGGGDATAQGVDVSGAQGGASVRRPGLGHEEVLGRVAERTRGKEDGRRHERGRGEGGQDAVRGQGSHAATVRP